MVDVIFLSLSLYFRSKENVRSMNCSDDDLLNFDDATSARTSLASRSKYAQHCLSQLAVMRQQNNRCDLSIEINKKQIFCHKFLLIAVSDYFKAMFDGLSNDFQILFFNFLF